MEATFYEDSRFREKAEMVTSMKRPMTLDLNSAKFSKKGGKVTTLLTSPDLHMLKLASPELERMIIAQHGLPNSTSTPNPNQCMYPPKPHDEREYHPRDFTEALSGFHTSSSMYQNLQVDNSINNALNIQCPPPSCSNAMENSSYYPQTSNCNSMVQTISTGAVSTGMGNYPAQNFYMNPGGLTIKEEPQIVPCMGVTPPLSPINMESQEKIKLERKRLRNRIAASKCRRRKLERIARLEDKVSMLKGENQDLTNVVNQLRDQVCNLKQQVMDHVRCGCEILNIRPDMQF